MLLSQTTAKIAGRRRRSAMRIEKRVELRGKVIYRATLDLGRGVSPKQFLAEFREELEKRRPKISILEEELVEKWEQVPSGRSAALVLNAEAERG
jgi:hypothetical protein